MADIRLQGPGEINGIASILKNHIGGFCELIKEVYHRSETNKVLVLVYEKYYYRASNRVSLTIVIEESNNKVIVDLIASGGGQGWLFKMDWGAEDNFVTAAEKILRRAGLN